MLNEYKCKRDFKITPEPSGTSKSMKPNKASKKRSLTFVIQKHNARRLHYDFRLEVDGVMVSWAVPKGPSLNPADKRLAVMTEDHPMEYNKFEGIIPEKQYGAGEVIIWDHGVYSPDENGVCAWTDKTEANERMREAIRKGKITFCLKGEKLEGSWTLVKLKNKDKDWLLIKRQDKFEDANTDVTELNASVVTGRTLQNLQQEGSDHIWTSKGAKPIKRSATLRAVEKVEEKPARAKSKISKVSGSKSQKSVKETPAAHVESVNERKLKSAGQEKNKVEKPRRRRAR
jgi:bifunctional non-homologous end joining protein LigD